MEINVQKKFEYEIVNYVKVSLKPVGWMESIENNEKSVGDVSR